MTKLTGMMNPAKRSEVRKKISEKLKGRNAHWLFGENNPAKKIEARKKIKNNLNSQRTRFKKGQIPWNKGLTTKNSLGVRKYTQKATVKRRTEAFKQMARANVMRNFMEGKWGGISPVEIQMELMLYSLGLVKREHFIPQYVLGDFVFDFYITKSNLMIECDGRDHRHSNKKKRIDRLKEECLKQNHIKLLRIRNEEIINNQAGVIDLLSHKLSINL